MVGIDPARRAGGGPGVAVRGRADDQHLALDDEIAVGDTDLAHDQPRGRFEHVLHLHRLEHDRVGPGREHVADRDPATDDPPRGRCAQRRQAGRDRRFGVRRIDDRRGHGDGLFAEPRVQRRPVRFEPAGVQRLRLHVRRLGEHAQQRQVRRQPLDPAFGERPLRAPQHPREVGRRVRDDELGEQRVVVRRRRRAAEGMRVDAHARPARQVAAGDPARRRPRPARGVERFGVDAPLHRMAARPRRRLRVEADRAQRRAARDRELRLHEVDAEHRLGHRVLDLQPRVGLDEDEGQVAGRGVDQEFEGREADESGGAGERERRRGQPVAQVRRQARTRRDLDQLLEAPLQRTVAFAERDDVDAVAHDLDLDVAGLGDEPLGVNRADAESRLRFRRAALECLGEPARIVDDAHAAAPAPGDRLQHHAAARIGQALLGEERGDFRQAGRAGARQQGHAAVAREGPGAGLVAESLELRRRRTDEDDPGGGAGAGEVGAFAEETVAGVERVAAAAPRGADERIDVEVGGRAGRPERDRGVGEPHVQRVGVVAGEHGDRAHAGVARRADQPDGDLAAIGDQEGVHRAGAFA